jgi:hypothetical protein
MESKQTLYDAESAGEDREELLSSTEVDDSLMGDEEKQWHSQQSGAMRLSKRNRFMSTFRSNRWLIGTTLQLVIVGLLVLVLLQGRQKETVLTQVGGDYQGGGPTRQLSMHRCVFTVARLLTRSSTDEGLEV